MTRPIAHNLGDLTTSEWHTVADRALYAGLYAWTWHLSAADRAELEMARDIGCTMATMQERAPDGEMRLLARRIPARTDAGRRLMPFQPHGGGMEAKEPAKRLASPVAPFTDPFASAFRPERRSPRAWHQDQARKRASMSLEAFGALAENIYAECGEKPATLLKPVDGDAA